MNQFLSNLICFYGAAKNHTGGRFIAGLCEGGSGSGHTRKRRLEVEITLEREEPEPVGSIASRQADKANYDSSAQSAIIILSSANSSSVMFTSGGRTGPPDNPTMSIAAFTTDTSYPFRRLRSR
jgi:hypothetical protein